MNSVWYGILVTRPHNVAIAAAAIVVGALTGPTAPADTARLLWAALAAALITAGGNVLNDVIDIAVDAVNKPGRVLPSGRLGRTAALRLAVILLVAGLALTLLLPLLCLLIAIASTALIVFYNLYASGRPVIGNLIVSLLTAVAFPFGSLAVGAGWWGLIPGAFALAFDMGREIIKDLEDCEADRCGGLNTLPIAAGERAARWTAIGALLILLILLPVPHLTGWLHSPYLLIVLPGVGVPVAIIIAGLRRPRASSVYRRFQIVLKVDMIVGLAAVLAG